MRNCRQFKLHKAYLKPDVPIRKIPAARMFSVVRFDQRAICFAPLHKPSVRPELRVVQSRSPKPCIPHKGLSALNCPVTLSRRQRKIAMEIKLPIGARIQLPGHFDAPVILEDARPLPTATNVACGWLTARWRKPSFPTRKQPRSLPGIKRALQKWRWPTQKNFACLIESARIRLAYAHDRQFAVSLSGIRTLPHQIEAVYRRCCRSRACAFCSPTIPARARPSWRVCSSRR